MNPLVMIICALVAGLLAEPAAPPPSLSDAPITLSALDQVLADGLDPQPWGVVEDDAKGDRSSS